MLSLPVPLADELPFVTHANEITAGAISDDGRYAATASQDEIYIRSRDGHLAGRSDARGTRYLDWSPGLRAFRAGYLQDGKFGSRVVGIDGIVREAMPGSPDDRIGPGRFEVLTFPAEGKVAVTVLDKLGILPQRSTVVTNCRTPVSAAYSGVTKRLYVSCYEAGTAFRLLEMEVGKGPIRVVKKAWQNYGKPGIAITPNGRRLLSVHNLVDPRSGKLKNFHSIGTPDPQGVTDFTSLGSDYGRLVVNDFKTGRSQTVDVFPDNGWTERGFPSFDGTEALVYPSASTGSGQETTNRSVRWWSSKGTIDLVNEPASVPVRARVEAREREEAQAKEARERANVPAANGTEADYRRWFDRRVTEITRTGASLILTAPKIMPMGSFGGALWTSSPFDVPLGRAVYVLIGAPLPRTSPFPLSMNAILQTPRPDSKINWDDEMTEKVTGTRNIIGDRLCADLQYNRVIAVVGPDETYDKSAKTLRLLYTCAAPVDAEIRIYMGPIPKEK